MIDIFVNVLSFEAAKEKKKTRKDSIRYIDIDMHGMIIFMYSKKEKKDKRDRRANYMPYITQYW